MNIADNAKGQHCKVVRIPIVWVQLGSLSLLNVRARSESVYVRYKKPSTRSHVYSVQAPTERLGVRASARVIG